MKDDDLTETLRELAEFGMSRGKMTVADYEDVLAVCGKKSLLTPMTGDQFRAIREKLRLSQAALASLIGISLTSVVKYEAGHKISNPIAILMRTMGDHGIQGLSFA